MDTLRVLAKAVVVISSLCLMLGFVWYRSAGAGKATTDPVPPDAPPRQHNLDSPAPAPAALMPSSKSIVIPEGQWVNRFPSATLPGSKSDIVLRPRDAEANIVIPADTDNPSPEEISRQMIDMTSKSGRVFGSSDATTTRLRVLSIMPGSKSAIVFDPTPLAEADTSAQQQAAASSK